MKPVNTAREGGPLGAQSVRRPVAVLLSRFPLITETFILREVIEMERQGQPVVLVPLLREETEVVHAEARPWIDRAVYTPFFDRHILRANLRALLRRPLRYLRVLGEAILPTLRSPRVLAGTLGIFPKSVYLAERLDAMGVRHLHAHFATHPATAAFIASRMMGARFSFTAHAHDIFVPWRTAGLGVKVRNAAFVRTISDHGREHLGRLYGDEVRDRTRVIHVGVDPGLYAGRDGDEEAPEELRILSVAALKPYKGLSHLVEACRLLREAGVAFRCEVVGRGPLRESLEREIREAGLDGVVRLRGALPQDEVAGLVRAADVFVLPSIVATDGQMEGIPVALMEAMAAGRPVVASAISGIPELIEHGRSGLLTEPGDAAGIAGAVRHLAEDPARARIIGACGARRVRHAFDLERCTESLLDAIRTCDEPQAGRLDALFQGSSAALLQGEVSVMQTHERQDSVVAELLVKEGDGEHRLVYKQQRRRPGQSRPPAQRARHEHETLLRLHDAFHEDRPGWSGRGDGSHGVPRPLHLDEEAGAVLMERCEGMSLDHWIRQGRAAPRGRRRTELAGALKAAGAWLQRFQSCTRVAGADPDRELDDLVARAWGAVRACRGKEISESSADEVLERTERLREWVRPGSMNVCGVHGDFWPGNIFVDPGGGVQVIDFEGFRDGLPWEDAARFLVHLELFFAWPGLRQRYRAASSLFLEGLVGQNGGLDPSALALCRIAAALEMLAGTSARPSAGSFRDWRRRKALLRIFRTG